MKWINGGEGTALSFGGIPLISVERKMKTTSQIPVIIISSKNHQWMIKLVGKI